MGRAFLSDGQCRTRKFRGAPPSPIESYDKNSYRKIQPKKRYNGNVTVTDTIT